MNRINQFMLDVTAGLLSCYIEDNSYNEWSVEVVNDGLKLINKATNQYTIWNIYEYDCDFKIIKGKIEKFLNSNNQ